MRKRILALLVLAALTLSACGMRQEQGEQVRYGYVADYNAAAHTLLLDEVEWLTPDDAQRLSQLGLTLERGEKFRIYNEKNDEKTLKTATDLVFYRYDDSGVLAGTADGYGENSTGTFTDGHYNASDNQLLPGNRPLSDGLMDGSANMGEAGAKLGDAANAARNVGDAANGVAGDVARGVGEAAGDAARGVGEAAGDVAGGAENLLNNMDAEMLPNQTPETVDEEKSVEQRNQGTPGYQLIDYPFAGQNWQIRNDRVEMAQLGNYLQQRGERGPLCRLYLRDGVVVAVEELQNGLRND